MITNLKSFFKDIHRKGFFYLLSANVLVQILGFCTQLYLGWLLAPEDIGRIKILLTFTTIATTLGGLSFHVSILKLCSENRDKDEEVSLFKKGLTYIITSTIIVYIILIITNIFGWTSSDIEIRRLFPIAMIPVITNSLFNYFTAYFKAKKNFQLFSKLILLNKSLLLIGILILTYYYQIIGYWAAQNIAVFIILMICILIFYKNTKTLDFQKNIQNPFKQHWNIAKFSLGINITDQISAAGDILLLNFFITDMTEIGYYSFAAIFVLLLQLIPNTAQQITAPYFSEKSLHYDDFIKTYKKYQSLYIKLIWGSFCLAVIFVPLFLHFLYSGKYDHSLIYFIILAIGWSFRGMTYLKDSALFGLKKLNREMKSSIICVCINLTISLILIKYFGVMGAAFGSLCGGIVTYIVFSFIFNKTIKKQTLSETIKHE